MDTFLIALVIAIGLWLVWQGMRPKSGDRSRAMRPRLARARNMGLLAVLCVLLGCATTVAVALSIAYSSSVSILAPTPASGVLDQRYWVSASRAGQRETMWWLPIGGVGGPNAPPESRLRPPPGFIGYWSSQEFGWPLPAMWYLAQDTHPQSGWVRFGSLEFWSGSRERWLPTMFLWTGMVVNSIIYAVVWSVPFLTIAIAGRVLRQRAGTCAGCGYDLTGSTGVCPECGRPHSGHAAPSPSPVRE